MSQKSSPLQSAESVSQVLTLDSIVKEAYLQLVAVRQFSFLKFFFTPNGMVLLVSGWLIRIPRPVVPMRSVFHKKLDSASRQQILNVT
jgi:hypothetical protein